MKKSKKLKTAEEVVYVLTRSTNIHDITYCFPMFGDTYNRTTGQ